MTSWTSLREVTTPYQGVLLQDSSAIVQGAGAREVRTRPLCIVIMAFFFQGLAVVVDCLFNQGNSLGHPDVRQAYQASVGRSVQVSEFAEVFIHRDQDSVVRCGSVQQGRVPGVRPEVPCVKNVVSAVAEPLCQSASCAPVHDESHGPVIGTGASVSPDMTAWA